MQQGALRYRCASANIQLTCVSLALEFGNSCMEKIEDFMLHIFYRKFPFVLKPCDQQYSEPFQLPINTKGHFHEDFHIMTLS